MSTIPTDIDPKELLLEVMPNQAKESIAESGAIDELSDTEISLVFELSDDKYSYVVKDGKDFDIKEGDIENPNVRLLVAKETFENMLKSDSLDMVTGLMYGLNRQRYTTINSLKGSFTADLANDDGSVYSMEVVFNGANEPKANFKMTMADSIALMAKETNPVSLFMSGAMAIEGDMPFAMATQPLFT